MSWLTDPNWTRLDGTPVAGRSPTQLVMKAGGLTPRRFDLVVAAYRAFCTAKLTSIIDYHVANRVLADGTRVRIESVQGKDRVFVWAADEGETNPLLQGFVFEWNSMSEYTPAVSGRYVWGNCMEGAPPQKYTGFKKTNALQGRTWSSKKLSVRGDPVQLVLVGSDLLFVGTKRVQLTRPNGANETVQKAAACLVRSGANGVILRVVLSVGDSYVCVDYGAPAQSGASAEPFGSLRGFIDASTATEIRRHGAFLGTLTAAERLAFMAGGLIESKDKWMPFGDLRFNESGTEVACMATMRGAVDQSGESFGPTFDRNGLGIVVVDVISGNYSQQFPCRERGDTTTTTTTALGVDSASETTVGTSTGSRRSLLAVDFLGDTLVWAWKQVERAATYSRNQQSSINTGVTTHSSKHITYTITAGHSIYGELVNFTHSVGVTESSTNSNSGYMTASVSRSGGFKYLDVAFGGDLSRDGFCFGYSDQELTPTPSLTREGTYELSVLFQGADVPVARVRRKYDVFLGREKVAHGIEGGLINDTIHGTPTAERPHPSKFYRGGDGQLYFSGSGSRSVDTANYINSFDQHTASVYYGDSEVASTATGWAFTRFLGNTVDLSSGQIDAGGFYYMEDPGGVECVVSPLGDAVYVSDLYVGDRQPGDSSHPGLCHFIRKTDAGTQRFQLAYRGSLPEPQVGEYLIVPENGIFLLGPYPDSEPTP